MTLQVTKNVGKALGRQDAVAAAEKVKPGSVAAVVAGLCIARRPGSAALTQALAPAALQVPLQWNDLGPGA